MDSVESKCNRKLALINEAIDRYGSYLLTYLQNLCRQSGIDSDALFDDLFLLALERFPEDKILHVGYLRFKAYQLFVDEYRKWRRNPVIAVEMVPEISHSVTPALCCEAQEIALQKSFFEDHPVELTQTQQNILFLWGYHGYTYKEISKLTGVAPSTVADAVQSGKNKIMTYVQSQAYRKL